MQKKSDFFLDIFSENTTKVIKAIPEKGDFIILEEI